MSRKGGRLIEAGHMNLIDEQYTKDALLRGRKDGSMAYKRRVKGFREINIVVAAIERMDVKVYAAA